MPETTPLDDTKTLSVSLLLHVTFLFEALEGDMAAESASLPPTANVRLDLFRLTPLTEMVLLPGVVTVTMQDALLVPSAIEIALIAAEPAAFALTAPLLETVTTVVLLADQITLLFVALSGKTVALRVSLSPTTIDRLVLLRFTPVTGTVTTPTGAHVAYKVTSLFGTVNREPPK
jgi:hypothetical protein